MSPTSGRIEIVRQLSTSLAVPPYLSIAEHGRSTVSTVLVANSDSRIKGEEYWLVIFVHQMLTSVDGLPKDQSLMPLEDNI